MACVKQRRKTEDDAIHAARPNRSTKRPNTGVRRAEIRKEIDTTWLACSCDKLFGFIATNTDVKGMIELYPPTQTAATAQKSNPGIRAGCLTRKSKALSRKFDFDAKQESLYAATELKNDRKRPKKKAMGIPHKVLMTGDTQSLEIVPNLAEDTLSASENAISLPSNA